MPTLPQAGVDGVAGSTWFALVAPAATPKPIIARLHAETVRALRQPEMIERFNKLGATLIGNSPAELDKFLGEERAKWGPLIKELGLKLE